MSYEDKPIDEANFKKKMIKNQYKQSLCKMLSSWYNCFFFLLVPASRILAHCSISKQDMWSRVGLVDCQTQVSGKRKTAQWNLRFGKVSCSHKLCGSFFLSIGLLESRISDFQFPYLFVPTKEVHLFNGTLCTLIEE